MSNEKKLRSICLLWLLFVAALSSFSYSESAAPLIPASKSASSKSAVSALYLIGIDSSGSYAYKKEAASVAEVVLESALIDSFICARTISEDSYLSNNGLLTTQPPTIQGVDDSNPFMQNRASKAHVKKKREE